MILERAKFFSKPPGGRATPEHQDGAYFKLDRLEAVRRWHAVTAMLCQVTLWLALDRVDGENGCLQYRVRSHKTGLLPHTRSGTLGFSLAAIVPPQVSFSS